MHERLLQVTLDLDAAQEALTTGYEADLLYAFRVASRRIRSILKQIDSHRARGLRKTWGGLAAVTGNARDWDVFLVSAEQLLDATSLNQFRAINAALIDFHHEAVLEMVRSRTWQRHRQEWDRFLNEAQEPHDPAEHGAAVLDHALERARRRLKRALKRDTDRAWHKFRIAVKEVRYVAEANPALPGSESLALRCKPLQTLLGDWHDTVVQLSLLDELPPEPVHLELKAAIQARKVELLSHIRATLTGTNPFEPDAE
jgi:CHAD domain-containing protein